MRAIEEYVRDVFRHWVWAVTSTLFAAWATFYGLSGGKPLALGALAAMAVALFVIASYLAWKDKRDHLHWILDRKRMASVLGEVWDEATAFWEKGCASSTPDEAKKWCTEYEDWLTGAKMRVASEVDEQESNVIFRIGDARNIPGGPGANADQRRKMSYLSIHLTELREAVRRYLPSSLVYSPYQPPG